MKNVKLIVAILAVVVVVLAGIYFSKDKGGNKMSGDVIKIGLSAPMSGEAANYGEAIFGGASLAVKEINEAGGINGKKVELVVEDDQCSSEGAKAVSKLVNIDKVDVLVGPLCSAAAGPSVPIAQNAGVPTIIIASAPGLTNAGDYIFRNYPSDAFQGKFAAEFLYNNLNKRKAAVIYVKNDWGQGLRNMFIKRFEELGGDVVFDEGVLQDSTDLRTQISKAKASNPDVLYFVAYPQNSVAGLKQIKEIGLNVTVVGGDSLADDSLITLPEADGVIYTVGKTNNPKEFQTKVTEVTGKTTNTFTPYAYDAVNIFADVIKKVGTDKNAIKEALKNLSYTSGVALPLVKFDPKGDLSTAEFEVMIIKDGKAVVYK